MNKGQSILGAPPSFHTASQTTSLGVLHCLHEGSTRNFHDCSDGSDGDATLYTVVLHDVQDAFSVL